jgi:6-phosphogluconolactonase (cycloisomerase 2 family)
MGIDRTASSANSSEGRRQFIKAGVGFATAAAFPSLAFAGRGTPARFAYVGTYTRGAPGGDSGAKSNGVYVLSVNAADGSLAVIQDIPSDNPSFLCLDPRQRHLYVAVETDDFEGDKQGAIESYRIDQANGKLTFLNRVGSKGAWPCDLECDPSGRFLVAANYGGANFVVAPILENGQLGALSGVYANTGTGPNKQRQEAPHPHCVEFDRTGNYLATADLGIDKVQIFRLDSGAGKLVLVSDASVAPGAGPRHAAFHPNGRYLYVINELNATITAFRYANGRIGKEIQTIGTVPADFPAAKSTAEIMIHPSGKFLYGSNRKFANHPVADAIVGYSVDATTGKLTLIEHTTHKIQFPRHFNIEPGGSWLYACNQKGDSIVQFAIDPRTGRLGATGHVAQVPVPVSMAFKTK